MASHRLCPTQGQLLTCPLTGGGTQDIRRQWGQLQGLGGDKVWHIREEEGTLKGGLLGAAVSVPSSAPTQRTAIPVHLLNNDLANRDQGRFTCTQINTFTLMNDD